MLRIVTTREQFLQHTEPSVTTYFDGMSLADRAARRPHSHTLDAYVGSVVTGALACDIGTPLALAVAEAEARLQRTGRLDARFRLPHSMLLMSASLPWRVARLDDAAENGWPHTHGDVIILPSSMLDALKKRSPGGDHARHRRLVELLVHERVHVMQRMDPEAARQTIRAWYGDSVRPVAHRRDAVAQFAERLRSNPDIDAYVYHGYPLVMAFPSLRDAAVGGMGSAQLQEAGGVRGGRSHAQEQEQEQEQQGYRQQPHEHPYESMAYDFARAAATA
jgi:hypothetical protein